MSPGDELSPMASAYLAIRDRERRNRTHSTMTASDSRHNEKPCIAHSSRVDSSSGTVAGTTDRRNSAVVAASSRAADPSTKPVVRRAAGEALIIRTTHTTASAAAVAAAHTAPARRSASTIPGAEPSCSTFPGHARQPLATGSKTSAGANPNTPRRTT